MILINVIRKVIAEECPELPTHKQDAVAMLLTNEILQVWPDEIKIVGQLSADLAEWRIMPNYGGRWM